MKIVPIPVRIIAILSLMCSIKTCFHVNATIATSVRKQLHKFIYTTSVFHLMDTIAAIVEIELLYNSLSQLHFFVRICLFAFFCPRLNNMARRLFFFFAVDCHMFGLVTHHSIRVLIPPFSILFYEDPTGVFS